MQGPDVSKSMPRGRVTIASVMFFAAAITLAYWLIWFGIDRDILASSHADYYYHFENAFPAADAWLGITLVIGAIGILRLQPWGLLATLLAGGAGIYLGCMDVLFDVENGIYQVPRGGDPSAVMVEAVINVLTFGLGILVISWIWRQRIWLLRGETK